MNVHVFQHVPFEGPARIGGWASAHGHRITFTHWISGERPPAIQSVDLLVVMGGPMSVYEEHLHPSLREEKHFIRQAIAAGRRVLGVCLGAQLLAEALGARVYPHTCREVGWFPVRRTVDTKRSRLFADFPDGLDVFHWHGDTFDIPAGAEHVLASEACPNQAFVFEERAVGLQFHIEIEPAGVATLIEQCPGDLRMGRFIQSAAEMRTGRSRYARIHEILTNLLDSLNDLKS